MSVIGGPRMATRNNAIVKIDETPLSDGVRFISNHLESDPFPEATRILSENDLR